MSAELQISTIQTNQGDESQEVRITIRENGKCLAETTITPAEMWQAIGGRIIVLGDVRTWDKARAREVPLTPAAELIRRFDPGAIGRRAIAKHAFIRRPDHGPGCHLCGQKEGDVIHMSLTKAGL